MMNSDKLYTVKEIADIVGVTPQSIYQKINNQLKEYTVKDGNITRLKENVITDYYNISLHNDFKVNSSEINDFKHILKDFKDDSSDLKQDNESTLNNFKNNSSILNGDIITFLKEQIQLKDNLLQEKDNRINELTNKITELTDKLTVLLENSQQLQQNQQLLAARTADEEGNKQKKSLFLRIFRKK